MFWTCDQSLGAVAIRDLENKGSAPLSCDLSSPAMKLRMRHSLMLAWIKEHMDLLTRLKLLYCPNYW